MVNPSINLQKSKNYAELILTKERITKYLEERQNICVEKEYKLNCVQSLATKYSKQTFIDKINGINILKEERMIIKICLSMEDT